VSILKRIKGYCLRKFTRKESSGFDVKQSRQVLFFRYDRIGDMVITTPVFRELKQAYPDIEITVLASKVNQEVLANNPYVDKIYINHKNNFLSDLPIVFKLRRQMFDVCVEFDHSVVPHAIWRLIIIKPKKVISVVKDGRYGVKGNELELYDYYTEKKQGVHFKDIWLATLTPFAIKAIPASYDLFCTNEQKSRAKCFLKKYNDKLLVAINLEGAVKGKRIKFDEFYAISRALHDFKKDIQVVVISTPKKHQDTKEKLSQMALRNVVMGYQTKCILDVAALIECVDVVITPDTSIVHIASAFNKPIVSIHENNQDSFQLFKPSSKTTRTVFSPNKNTLDGYNVEKVIAYSTELIKDLNG